MKEAKPSRQRWATAFILLLILVGLAVVVLDWNQVRKILGETDWKLVPLALLVTAISYTSLSYGWAVTNQIFGVRMRRRDLAQIGFVSTILNHLISAGGAAGFSVRFLMMGAQGAAIKDIVAASLFYTYLSGLGMLAILPIGLLYLFLKHPLSTGAATGIGIGAVALFLVFILASALVFNRSLRTRVLHLLSRAARAVIRRDVTATMDEFDETMTRGVAAMRHQPLTFALLMGSIALDWTSSMASLWFCFDALGDPVKVGVLMTGFAIGVTAGVLSMVPGGLGVQEGSMSGIYALLGVPLQQAVLAAILFRVVYYLVPYLVSLGFYGRLLHQMRRAESLAATNAEPVETPQPEAAEPKMIEQVHLMARPEPVPEPLEE
jgi:uncharacterized protein (TIRG00374 family)